MPSNSSPTRRMAGFLLIVIVALTGFARGTQAQTNEIITIPLTVVTIPAPKTPQNPSGLDQKLMQINDSSKQSINLNVTINPALNLTPPSGQSLKVNTSLGYGQAFDPDLTYAGKTGAPVCGGFWHGKLQPKCPPSPATYVAEAVGACPAGSFLDPGAGSCWACPDGYIRTADALTSSTACAKADPSVPLKRMAGKFVSGLCPAGSFFDPIRGGECYSCPSGYKRSAAHIDADNACFVPGGEQLVRATRIDNTPWPHDCNKFAGSFHDAWDGGACWRCPSGYNRTGNHINSNQGCSRSVPEQHAKATPRGQAQCKAGEFSDPRNGGECWRCPAGTHRTVFPVNGGEACEQRAGFRQAKASEVSAFSCPAGSFLDLISSRDPNVRNRIEKQIAETGKQVDYGKSAGGTCWSCPPGYDREVYHVAGENACGTRSIKWQPAPYIQPGLLGLAGSREVALALLSEWRLIEGLIAALAADTNTPLEQMRRETYAEIAKSPQTSGILAAAMYKRIEAAVRTPAQATADERRLVASLAEAIRQYRIFIAQNAIDAYDQWVEARGRRLTDDAKKAGPGSLEEQRMNQVAWKGGEIPPDFMEIVSELVVLNITAPAAMQSFLTASTTFPQLKNAIFPHRRAAKALAREAVKTANTTKSKSAGVLSKMTGKIFKQAMKFGPQILADVAVEMIVGTIEHFEAVLNARPKLVTALGGAKNPVDMLRELQADEGWLHREWSVALGAGDLAPVNLGEFASLTKAALEQAASAAGSAPNPTTAPATSQGWRQMPGAAIEIGMGGGSLWVIGTNPVPGGFGVYRWNGNNWDDMKGGGVRIDVDGKGYAFLANDKGEMFRHTGSGWAKLPGLAKDVGIGENGTAWHIGTNAVAGGFGIYRWTNNAWQDMKGGAVRIDVDGQGNAWVVNDKGDIFRWTGSAWAGVPGKAHDIGIGADGSVFVVGPDSTIHKWNGNTWIKRDGLLNEITVDAKGVPFGVNGAKQIWMGYP